MLATMRPMREALLLSNNTIAPSGFGAIGKQVAKLLREFYWHHPLHKIKPLSTADEAELGVKSATVADILKQAGIVSLHCAVTPTSPCMGAQNMTITPHLVAVNADTFEPTAMFMSATFRTFRVASQCRNTTKSWPDAGTPLLLRVSATGGELNNNCTGSRTGALTAAGAEWTAAGCCGMGV